MSITIGDASRLSGVPAKTIRYYESIGLIGAPEREANHYRVYSEVDVATLRFVGRARRLGFTIGDLKNLVALYRDRARAERVRRRGSKMEQYIESLDRFDRRRQQTRDVLGDLLSQLV